MTMGDTFVKCFALEDAIKTPAVESVAEYGRFAQLQGFEWSVKTLKTMSRSDQREIKKTMVNGSFIAPVGFAHIGNGHAELYE